MTDFVDPFYDLFLRFSSNGETLTGEDEWKGAVSSFVTFKPPPLPSVNLP